MKTTLIIEDNDDIRENVCELLELEGYRVLSATDGRKGLQLARQELPDIVLCDIMIPLADGYEVLRQLKSEAFTATIPFIFLTAKAERLDIELGMRLGANGYIRKPFETEELLEVLKQWVTADLKR